MKTNKKCWLNNTTVVITGASSGIGRQLTKVLIENFDCKIIGIGRNTERLEESKKLYPNNFSYYAFDVSNYDNWLQFDKELTNDNINIDVVINNAGIMPPFAKFETYSLEQIEATTKTNYLSIVYSVKVLLNRLKESKKASIINISSSAGLTPIVGESLYAGSKHAVKGFTESIMQEYRKSIYIAGVYPGFIKTNIMQYQTIDTSKNKIIQGFSMPVEKMVAKLVKRIKKKKRRIVLGVDGRSMDIFMRLFPKMTPRIIKTVFKMSKEDLFKELF